MSISLEVFQHVLNVWLEALNLGPCQSKCPVKENKQIKMENYQGDFKSIKVIKFNNRKEDWTEFALKFKAIANERGYDEILEGTRNAPSDTDMTGGEEYAQIKAANKRGYRDLILATKDTSLTMVANAQTDELLVEYWGLLPLIPLLQCVNRLGFEICSVNSCQSEQGSLVTLI